VQLPRQGQIAAEMELMHLAAPAVARKGRSSPSVTAGHTHPPKVTHVNGRSCAPLQRLKVSLCHEERRRERQEVLFRKFQKLPLSGPRRQVLQKSLPQSRCQRAHGASAPNCDIACTLLRCHYTCAFLEDVRYVLCSDLLHFATLTHVLRRTQTHTRPHIHRLGTHDTVVCHTSA